jgi:guanylate kinase
MEQKIKSMKLIIVGKTASGKDYLKNRLREKGLKASVNCTTRPIRAHEQDGVDYHFLTTEEFKKGIEQDFFIEYEKFNGWYYGTPIDEFEESDIIIMNINGINQLSSNIRKQCMIIFLDIDATTRELRLAKRKDSNDSIERRMQADEEQFKEFSNYDIRITNPNF